MKLLNQRAGLEEFIKLQSGASSLAKPWVCPTGFKERRNIWKKAKQEWK